MDALISQFPRLHSVQSFVQNIVPQEDLEHQNKDRSTLEKNYCNNICYKLITMAVNW